MSKALVVFHGFGHGAFGNLFGRPGFRHCFVCIAHQGAWLRADTNGLPYFECVCGDSFDLAAFYRAAGLTVAEVETRTERPRLWLMLGTCVGFAKRMIGIRAPLVFTPHQLYRRLSRAA